MEKNFILQLTIKLYQLTLLFPKKEPLRYKIREKADEILADFSVLQFDLDFNAGSFSFWDDKFKRKAVFSVERNLGILNSYFELAKWQNWVSYFDILELEQGYDKIRDKIKALLDQRSQREGSFGVQLQGFKTSISPEISKKEIVKINKNKHYKSVQPRQEKILALLEEKGKAQVGEVNKILADVSKRTLRRDFRELLEKGLIERSGQKNTTFYRLVR